MCEITDTLYISLLVQWLAYQCDIHCVSKSVPSLTFYNFNTHPTIFIVYAIMVHVNIRLSKIGYMYNFLNCLAITYFILL